MCQKTARTRPQGFALDSSLSSRLDDLLNLNRDLDEDDLGRRFRPHEGVIAVFR